LKLETINLGI